MSQICQSEIAKYPENQNKKIKKLKRVTGTSNILRIGILLRIWSQFCCSLACDIKEVAKYLSASVYVLRTVSNLPSINLVIIIVHLEGIQNCVIESNSSLCINRVLNCFVTLRNQLHQENLADVMRAFDIFIYLFDLRCLQFCLPGETYSHDQSWILSVY